MSFIGKKTGVRPILSSRSVKDDPMKGDPIDDDAIDDDAMKDDAIYRIAAKHRFESCGFTRSGGARRDRTADLYNAIVALSQLSYGPVA